ncbi:nicotinamide riboside kinase 1 [Rhodnius prolixus]
MDQTSNWIVIGLAGATNSGKTTLARRLMDQFPNAVHMKQDNYFLSDDDPRQIKVENLGHNNWEKLTALDMDRMMEDIYAVLRSPCTSPRLLILDGFLILNEPRIVSLCHAKFYLDVSYDECRRRRLGRSYDPPDVPGYFEQVVWPESREAKQTSIARNPDTVILNGEMEIDNLVSQIVDVIEKKTNLKRHSC